MGSNKTNRESHVSGAETVGDETRASRVVSDVLHLEIARQGNHLNIGAHESPFGDESTIRHYERIPISPGWIETRCDEIVVTLNRANRSGRLAPGALTKLKELGQVFYDEFFPSHIKQAFSQTKAEYLKIYLDDRSVHIPWELLHDGVQFLCSRFNVGRLVKTRQSVFGSQRRRELSQPLEMLVLADPQGDLQGAYEEGRQIRDYMDMHHEYVHVSLRTGNVVPDFVKEKIRSYDLVHFAGHAEYNLEVPDESGWWLTGKVLSAREIVNMVGNAAMPYLIFSNACHSARTTSWTLRGGFQQEVFGLANAFLLAGVKHYIGTFWEILDEPSSRFALEFYKHLLAGNTTGEAVRLSRRVLVERYGEESVVWASYLLYGDPTSFYVDHLQSANTKERKNQEPPAEAKWSGKTREELIDFSGDGGKHGKKNNRFVMLVVAAVAVLLFAGYWVFSAGRVREQERNVLTYYQVGDFESALRSCDDLEQNDPDNPLLHLVRGDVFFRRGALDAAQKAYAQALRGRNITESQKAQAYLGLGRIASVNKKLDDALTYYEKASAAAPQRSEGYLSQAFVLETTGKEHEAHRLMSKALDLASDDASLRALIGASRDRISRVEEKEKKDRIDKLIEEISGAADFFQPEESDNWTSFPLSLWVMGLDVEGFAFQEGQERLVVSGIVDRILQKSPVRPVERDTLDKVLGEIKFGGSKLADRESALTAGKMLAARLILSGRIVYSEKETQISLRLIETETGQITAAVSESIGTSTPISILTEKLADGLIKKITAFYPIRGKISHVGADEVDLNIGSMVGVRPGQQYSVVDRQAMLEIIHVETGRSSAAVRGETEPLGVGMKVEIAVSSSME